MEIKDSIEVQNIYKKYLDADNIKVQPQPKGVFSNFGVKFWRKNNKLSSRSTPSSSSRLRRSKNLRDVIIDPSKFGIDNILMMLDIEKLQELNKQFENIIEEDIQILRDQENNLEQKDATDISNFLRQNSTNSFANQRIILQEKAKINIIVKQFQQADGLTMSQFVRVMLRILTSEEKRENVVQIGSLEYYNLVYGLIQMFEEIDINGDGMMEWTELMQFFLDTVNLRNQMTFDIKKIEEVAQLDEKTDEGHYYSNVSKISGATNFSVLSDFSEVERAKENLSKRFVNENFQRYQRSKINIFRESETLFDKIQRKSHILKAIYCEKHQKYILCDENKSNSFTIAKEISCFENGGKSKPLGIKDMANKLVPESSTTLDFKKPSHILSMAWSETHNILGLVATDGRLFFYQSKAASFQLVKLFIIDASDLPIQTQIWYMPSHDIWLTAGKDFILREWIISQASQSEIQPKIEKMSIQQIRQQLGTQKQKSENFQSWSANATRLSRFQNFRKKTLNSQEEEYFYDGFISNTFTHSDLIFDVCEIRSPLLVASACMDKMIRLISLKDKKVVGVFNGHQSGVRQLDYSEINDGYVLSVASESYVNVWNLEGGVGAIQSSLNNVKKTRTNTSLSGTLQGGNQIIRFVRCLSNSPFCASIDQKFCIKIWDFTKRIYLQSINPTDSGFANLQVNDLIFIGQMKRFAVISKRMFFYDAYHISSLLHQKKEQKKNKINDDKQNIPIGAQFNTYSGNFIVVTSSDIKIYSANSGELVKIFSDIKDSRSNSDIKSFSFDSRNRKILLGDSDGTVRALNLSNGVKIMTISNRNDQKFFKKRNRSILENKNVEINNIQVINGFYKYPESSLIVTSQWNNKLKFYDEKNMRDDVVDINPYDQEPDNDQENDIRDYMKKQIKLQKPKKQENQLIIKKLDASDLGDQVVIMAFCKQQSLIATGNQQGLVMIWDMETCKLDKVIVAVKDSVTLLEFMDDYPILVCGGQDGSLSFWATKRDFKNPSECMGRFQNKDGINCGFVKVVKVHQRHQIFQSDSIVFDEASIDYHNQMCSEPRQEPRIQTAFQAHVLNYQRNKDKIDTYDRPICIIGTDQGFIKILDLTFLTDQFPDKHLKIIHEFQQKVRKLSMIQKVVDIRQQLPVVNPDQRSKIYHVSKHEHNPKIPFNPFTKVRSKVEGGKQLIEEAHERDSQDQQYVMSSTEIELNTLHHNLQSSKQYNSGNHSNYSVDSKDGHEVDKNYSVNFVMKVHEKQINSVKLIENDEKISFVTTSDDLMVKVFSIQQQVNGPLKFEQLGVIDLVNPQNNLCQWKFTYENESNMKKNKETFKDILKEISMEGQYHDNMQNKDIQNIRLFVKDPEKEKQDREYEMNADKRHQMLVETAIIENQKTYMEKENVMKKLEKMKSQKLEKSLNKLVQSQSTKVVQNKVLYKPDMKIGFPKIHRDAKQLDINQPTKLNFQGIGKFAQKQPKSQRAPLSDTNNRDLFKLNLFLDSVVKLDQKQKLKNTLSIDIRTSQKMFSPTARFQLDHSSVGSNSNYSNSVDKSELAEKININNKKRRQTQAPPNINDLDLIANIMHIQVKRPPSRSSRASFRISTGMGSIGKPPLQKVPRVKSVDQMEIYKDFLIKAVAATEELNKNTRFGQRQQLYGGKPSSLIISKQKSSFNLRNTILHQIEEKTPKSNSFKIPLKKFQKPPKESPPKPKEAKSEILSKILNSVQEIKTDEKSQFLKSSNSFRKVKSKGGFDVNEMIRDLYKNMNEIDQKHLDKVTKKYEKPRQILGGLQKKRVINYNI